MRCVHPVLFGVAVLAAVVGLSLAVGCSCEETEPAAPRVVKAGRPEPVKVAPTAPAKPGGGSKAGQTGGRSLVGESMLAAPGQYYGTVVRAPRHIRTSVGESTLKADLQKYKAMHDQYPPSLAALADWSGRPTPEPPKGHKHVYDPATGTVDTVPMYE